jgi:hypothetical protein
MKRAAMFIAAFFVFMEINPSDNAQLLLMPVSKRNKHFRERKGSEVTVYSGQEQSSGLIILYFHAVKILEATRELVFKKLLKFSREIHPD